MKTKALILGVIALSSLAEISSAQAKGAGATANKADSVRGVFVVLVPAGSPNAHVTWNTIDKATFQVQRSKVGDSCCNNASQPGLSANSWDDSPLPSSGTYVYRVIATLRTGQVVGEGRVSYTAPAVSPAAPTSGRYRLSMTSISVVTPTTDDATMADGVGDEIFAAAAVVRADRATGAKLGATVVRSKEYGDVGSAGATQHLNRIRAGSASAYGGLTGGNSVGGPGTPGAETFPFVLWEGDLTDGGEAVVVFPSIWERDTTDFVWKDYAANWTSASAPILGSPLLQNQYSSTSLTPVVAPIATGTVSQGVTGPVYGAYYYGLTWMSGVDRMIGMVPSSGYATYAERMIVLTREKLAGLAVGGTADLQIPLTESIPSGGSYLIILRVERIG